MSLRVWWLAFLGGLAVLVLIAISIARMYAPPRAAPSEAPVTSAPTTPKETAHITATLFFGAADGQSLAPMRRDREQPVGGGVLGVKGGEVEIRQHIAVHDQEVFRQIADSLERPHRPQRLVLERVINLDTPFRSVAEECLDQFRLMVDRHRHALEAVRGELTDDDFQDWVVADWHQRLGQDDGVRPKPRPFAASQNHGTSRHRL